MENENERREENAKGRELCGICGKPIFDEEEKVYCPDCGTPMHRLCFSMTHSCPNEEFHRYSEPPAKKPAQTTGPVCDICGRPLRDDDEKVYCPECGTPVHTRCWEKEKQCPNEWRHVSGFDWNRENAAKKPSEPQQPETRVYKSFEEFTGDMLSTPIRSGEDGEELTCNGVSQAELLHFLGTRNFSTPRFFSLFLNMANTGKVVSMNLSALFFSPFYHFYRRMTGPAVILTLTRFVLLIPTFIAQMMVFGGSAAGSQTVTLTPELSLAVQITNYISLAIQILLLLFSDYIYMRWTVGKILDLRERYKDAPEEEYYSALESRGNPGMVYVLAGLALMVALFWLFSGFLSSSAGIMTE